MRKLILPASLVLMAACQSVPYTGRHHLMLVSEDEELGMGEQAYREALAHGRKDPDQGHVEMVRRVGARLAKAADKPEYKWEFSVIDDPKTINAWCLPGGKVAVYTGILAVTKDETGLAVVMGHEISHALARHGAERMSQGMVANLGGEVLSAAVSSQSPGAQNLFGNAYGLGVGLGVMLPFSRAQESEADHIGLILMAKAGYDPRAAVDFWERMKKATGDTGGGGLGRYLRTHPPDDQRIRQIQDWLPEALQYYKAN